MKLGEHKIDSYSSGINGDAAHECIIEVHYEESTGLQFHPLVRYINAKGRTSAKTQTLFVTAEQIRQARKEVLTTLATKTDPLHRYVELLIPRRIHTEDTFAILGAYVEHPTHAEPSMLQRRIRMGLERWVNMCRNAEEFARTVNPNLQTLSLVQHNPDCRKSLAMAGIKYLFVEIYSRRETIRDEWDFDSPLKPIAK